MLISTAKWYSYTHICSVLSLCMLGWASDPVSVQGRSCISCFQGWLSQCSPPSLSCSPASSKWSLSFPKERGFIFPFPGCNRLTALPSGESVDCPSLQRLLVYPHPPQHRRDRGEDFGLDVSFCSDAIWLSSTCPMKDAFLGLSLVIFLRVWWSLFAGELEKEAWNFPCPQWLCSLSLTSPYSASTIH